MRTPDPIGRACLGHLRGLLTVALVLAVTPQLVAAEVADPDWPCIQRKVASLSPASMWPGLGDDTLSADWRSDPDVAALVARIAPRRVSVEDAQQAIRSFAAELGEGKEETLKLLFLGLFQTLDGERSEVMGGIERFARSQAQQVQRILAERSALEEMRQGAETGPEITERSGALTMAIRVFEDRRASLTHVCDVPRIIEQRLFALVRTIQAELA